MLLILLFGGLETWRRWQAAQVARGAGVLPGRAARPRDRRRRLPRRWSRCSRSAWHATRTSRGTSATRETGFSLAARAGSSRAALCSCHLSARSISRCCSRSRIVSRLSRCSLPLRERELDLRARAGEVDPRRDQREPVLLRLADQPLDLLACAAGACAAARGRGPRAAAGAYGAMWHVVEPDLAVAHEPRRSPSGSPCRRAAT